jgi:hypothetical protein
MSTEETTDKKIDIKLEKLVDDGAGGNNFGGCEIKWRSKLDAYNLWKYVEGPRPVIVELREDKVMTGRVQGGEEGEVPEVRTFVVAGNKEEYEASLKENAPWLDGNKRTLSAIVDALPDHKLYLVKDIRYAADAWKALQNEYKPVNARTVIRVKQDLMNTRPASHNSADVEKWLVYMIAKKQALNDACPDGMLDFDFACQLITLMPQTGKWNYTFSVLSRAMLSKTLDGLPLTSTGVVAAIREQTKLNDTALEEEAVMAANAGMMVVAPTYPSFNPVVPATGMKRPLENVSYAAPGPQKRFRTGIVPYYNSGSPSNPPNLYPNSSNRPADMTRTSTSQGASSRGHLYCVNTYCKRPVGHLQPDCFAYGGGKVGQYPEWWRGPWNIHVHPAQRPSTPAYPQGTRAPATGANQQQRIMYANPMSTYQQPQQYTVDSPEEVEQNLGSERILDNEIRGGVLDLLDLDDEVIESVNKLMLTHESKSDDTFWDTGATRAVFHDRRVFKNYKEFKHPIQVNGFGSNLATVARGLGWVDLESVVEEEKGKFTLTGVLHIPDARCNLVSGVRLDLKGAWTTTGDQKLTVYMKNDKRPFMVGQITNGLYKLNVKLIIQSDTAPNLAPSLSPSPAINPEAECKAQGSSTASVNPSLLDPGVFAIPSLASMYQPPSEEDKFKFFSIV